MSTGKVVAIAFFVSLVTSVCTVLVLDRVLVEGSAAEGEDKLQGVEVPLLTGMRPEQARRMLRDSELLLIVSSRVESAEVDEGLIVSQSPLEGSVARSGSEVDVVVSKGMPRVAVPDLAGTDQAQAVAQLEQVGLVAEIETQQSEQVARDQLISFQPRAGELLAHGAAVTLVVSEGGPQIEVPRLIRARIEGAKRLIRKAGFKVGEVTFRDDPEAPGGTVLRQVPKAGTMAEKGSEIDIFVNTFE
jgi:serine/threonine-protein kinase